MYVRLQALCIFVASYCSAQSSQASRSSNTLFDSDEILPITIDGDIKQLMRDRDNDSKYHSFRLVYTVKDGLPDTLPVSIKTRGHFRKMSSNCQYPPLLLKFSKSADKASSIFSNCEKLKLVMPCRDDKYVVKEWLMYRLYQLMTPQSFKARLVKVQLDNEGSKKEVDPFYGILLEEEVQMAHRNNAESSSRKLAPYQTDTSSFLRMAVFQYLICNTDWSIQYLQNMKLIVPKHTTTLIPVPYDFDHAGLVDAPYAFPAPELKLTSVTERRYRGYCMPDMTYFEEVFKFYNSKKREIYQLFDSCDLLDEKQKKIILKSLDEFYETLNNAEKAKTDFLYPCDKYGTGNIVIKGLKED